MKLNERELAIATEHVLRVHRMQEADRRRLAEATDIATLRETMLECGLPEGDVERALAELPALLARRKRRTRMTAWIALGAAASIAAVAVWAALPKPAPPPPTVFISATGPAEASALIEQAIAQLVRQHGYVVIAAPATANLAVQARVTCERVDMKAFRTNLLTVSSSLAIRVFDNKTGVIKHELTHDRGGLGLAEASACVEATRNNLHEADLASLIDGAPASAPSQ